MAGSDAEFSVAAAALARFDGRHLQNSSCSFVVPEIDSRGPLSSRYPDIVRRLNRDTAKLHVTSAPTASHAPAELHPFQRV
jgi:hypothetical protein